MWGLASYRRQGLSDEGILEAVEGLTPTDLEAAWEYIAVHSEEIFQAIHDNEAGDEGVVE